MFRTLSGRTARCLVLIGTLALAAAGPAAAAPPPPNVRINVDGGKTGTVLASSALIYPDGTVKVGAYTVCRGTITYQDGDAIMTSVMPYHNYQAIPIHLNRFPATSINDMATAVNGRRTTNVGAMGRIAGPSPCAARPNAVLVSDAEAGVPAAPSRAALRLHYAGNATSSDSILSLLAVRTGSGDVFLFRAADLQPDGQGFKIVSAGGGNIIATGGGNLVSAGGGNLVAAGGGNIVSAGGGNIVSAGGGNMVSTNGGNVMPAVIAALVSAGGGNLASAGSGNLLTDNGSGLTGFGRATSLISQDGSTLIGNAGGIFRVTQYRGGPVPPKAEVNICRDARISLAFATVRGQTGNARYMLPSIGASENSLATGRCDPALYAGGRYDSTTIAALVLHSLDCANATAAATDVRESAWIGEALYDLGHTPQAFTGCTASHYYPSGGYATSFADVVSRVRAYAGSVASGTPAVVGTVTKDKYGCVRPDFGVALFGNQNLFFADPEGVSNLNLSLATAFTCRNRLPAGVYAGNPGAIPVTLQLRPVNVPTAPPAAYGSVDRYGCKNGNFGVAVFSAQHLFFSDYQNVANLNLSRADSFTCSNLMPGGLYRGNPTAIPVALQLRAANVPTAVPEAHGSTDTYGCKNGNYGVAVFSKAHLFFGNYKSVPNLNLGAADALTCSNLMPPGLYRGDPNNIPASLQLQR